MFKLFSVDSLKSVWMACTTGYRTQIEYGKSYQLFTAGTSIQHDREGALVECFTVMFCDAKDTDGVIQDDRSYVTGFAVIPKYCLHLDESLAPNSIVWSRPVSFDHVHYGCASWNPGPKVINDRPKVSEQLSVPV